MNVPTALRRPPVLSALTVFVVLLVAVAVWFKPWGLILNETVSEAAPVPIAVTSPSNGAPTPTALAGLDRTGTFEPGEHEISGTVRFIHTGKGVVLRLENLATTNGPDVRVYLSRGANGEVGPGDFEVAPIKGNLGSQNYLLAVGTAVSTYDSVVIWCKRFSVGFGHAVLTA